MTTITINYLKTTIAQCEANVAVFQKRHADALAEYEARKDPHFKAWADLQAEAIEKNRAMADDMKKAVAILEMPQVTCPACYGTGSISGYGCGTCNGTGMVVS